MSVVADGVVYALGITATTGGIAAIAALTGVDPDGEPGPRLTWGALVRGARAVVAAVCAAVAAYVGGMGAFHAAVGNAERARGLLSGALVAVMVCLAAVPISPSECDGTDDGHPDR